MIFWILFTFLGREGGVKNLFQKIDWLFTLNLLRIFWCTFKFIKLKNCQNWLFFRVTIEFFENRLFKFFSFDKLISLSKQLKYYINLFSKDSMVGVTINLLETHLAVQRPLHIKASISFGIPFCWNTFHLVAVCLSNLLRHIQIQQWQHQNNLWNLFKVINV